MASIDDTGQVQMNSSTVGPFSTCPENNYFSQVDHPIYPLEIDYQFSFVLNGLFTDNENT